jgi:hypothetical protein
MQERLNGLTRTVNTFDFWKQLDDFNLKTGKADKLLGNNRDFFLIHDSALSKSVKLKDMYSQTCLQWPPLGPEKYGCYVEGCLKKISGK